MTQPKPPRNPLPPPSTWEKVKYKVSALILIAIILVAFGVSAAAYQKVFVSTIPVTLHADRAGLQMFPGNRVKVQGVDLGRVHSIDPSPDQKSVEIVLYVDPKLAAQVPVNVDASLDQLTAFGNKTVQLTLPASPSPEHLRAGTVIEVKHVAGEINGTFDQLTTLLNEIQPAKLNAVLGGFAQTFQDKGESLGITITKANAYLKKFNNDLPNLQRDFKQTAGFARVYADAGKDIADLVRNAGVVSTVFSDGDWPGVLREAGTFGVRFGDFNDQNGHRLSTALASLRPTTSLLKKYSPALTCFLDGEAKTWRDLSTAFTASGVLFEATPILAPAPYKYPQDLPQVGPGSIPDHPDCHGLPSLTPDEYSLADATAGPKSIAPGAQPNGPALSKEPALVQVFGPKAYLPNSLKGGK